MPTRHETTPPTLTRNSVFWSMFWSLLIMSGPMVLTAADETDESDPALNRLVPVFKIDVEEAPFSAFNVGQLKVGALLPMTRLHWYEGGEEFDLRARLDKQKVFLVFFRAGG